MSTQQRSTSRGLGSRGFDKFDQLKGVDKLITSGKLPFHDAQNSATELPLAKIVPAQGQPRQYFDEVALEELAASIRTQGIIQPLLVRPLPAGTYEIVAGERRWRAAKKAGLSTVPVVIRDLSDDEAMTAALIENLQREDLNPVEESRAMASLRDKLALSQEELAVRIGKSRSAVANALRLLQLPEPILASLQAGRISSGHARALLPLSDEKQRIELFDAIEARSLSVREVEAAVTYAKENGALPASILEPDQPKRARAPRSEKLPEIREAQNRLRRIIHPRVSIAGDSRTGRVTIPYDSQEELQRIIELLGK